MKRAVIYIPGLEDHRNGKPQAFFLWFWKIYGIKAVYHHMNWIDKQPFKTKLEGILSEIDKLASEDYSVSLIGTSAGASAAVNAYALRQDIIHSLVCVCGELGNPDSMGEEYYKRNPAFKDSMYALAGSLASLDSSALSKITSFKPLKDNIVRPSDTIIKGARSKTMPTSGHGVSITYALTVGSGRVARYIKK